ncbi:hypothetical protein BCR39DRAFT_547453 [Naematelia encephala]|uniref:BRCT domain-containing protein n=1 Tax=Naematelia encephala TaxID=71784 RepID=A0A1Y2AP63_9TREE|nr:hypothetical protein BCR39DRAFT_547453 [Naematelia encephala]
MPSPNLFQSLGYVYFSYTTPLSIVAKFYAHGGIVLTSQDPYRLPVDIYFAPPGDRLASYLTARQLVVHDPCWVDACIVEGRLVDLKAWVVECPHSVTIKTRRR